MGTLSSYPYTDREDNREDIDTLISIPGQPPMTIREYKEILEGDDSKLSREELIADDI